MDKLCKNCNHWDGLNCDHPKLQYDDSTEGMLDDGAGTSAPFGEASIETGPDFGCIHWEGRQECDDER